MRFSEIDEFLARAAAAAEVPGVVALAASASGLVYEGAFGKRDLETGAAMTADTVFRIASMTKAVTSVAALQLVEEGKLALEEPIGRVLPELSAPQVLEGFDEAGRPRLRAARQAMTLRHLLTHTAGFAYDLWDPALARYLKESGVPSILSGKLAALHQPLLFDPGERWEYGINTDWVGIAVERASGKTLEDYFRERITGPLGMSDTGFLLSAATEARLARVHRHRGDGSLEPLAREVAAEPEFFRGGGGLYGSGRDYLVFLEMLLGGGRLGRVQVLRPETVALLAENQIGKGQAGIMKSAMPQLSNDVDLFPGQICKWGLATLINAEPIAGGRSAGSLSWAGLYNSYYWIDRTRGVAAVLLTQVLPFADPIVLRLYREFERAFYRAL
jgi:methyl acetate hydrolase